MKFSRDRLAQCLPMYAVSLPNKKMKVLGGKFLMMYFAVLRVKTLKCVTWQIVRSALLVSF